MIFYCEEDEIGDEYIEMETIILPEGRKVKNDFLF